MMANDKDDDDLQAALALSMQQQHQSTTDDEDDKNNTTTMVSPGFETSTLLTSIYNPSSLTTTIKEGDGSIGSNKFMVAYCINLERLCIQAHWTAGLVGREKSAIVNISNDVSGGSVSGNGSSHSNQFAATPGLDNVLFSLMTGSSCNTTNKEEEEYIVQAFLDDTDKIQCLVKTLLLLELWRENVLFPNKKNNKQQCSAGSDKNDYNDEGVAAVAEEEEVEFEIEGGERDEDEYYDELNDVDGGNNNENNNNANTTNDVAISNTTTANNGEGGEEEVGLANRLANNGNALRTAFILHAETTIVSLLSLIFFKGVPPELLAGSNGSSGEDVLLSLVDYCARQLIFLGSPEHTNPALSRQKNPMPASQLSTYLQSRTPMDEIQDSMYDATYQTAIASVALSRYLCENVNELGPSLLSRMLEVHDFPLLLIPLVEEPPWTRRRTVEKKRGTATTNNSNSSSMMIWEKLDERNEWKEVPTSELLRVTQLEGQPWLALFHLTTSKSFRESYGLDEYRKSQLMRLRKYIHESLTDQLPVLGEVARYLDELSILGVPPAGQGVHRPSSNASSSGLLLQRVDTLRESIVGGKRNMLNDEYWKGVAQTQWDEIFSRVTDATDQELRRIASEVYGGDSGIEDGLAMLSNDGWTGLQTKEEGEPQSAIEEEDEEDWKVKMSKPIEKIVLNIMTDDSNGDNLASFELVPVQKNGTLATSITDTPLGQFTRLKMSVLQTDGEGEAIDPRAKVHARISFQRDPSSSSVEEEVKDVMISIDSIELPTVEHGTSQSSLYDEVGIELPLDTFSSKEWRQLGDVEGNNIILQLGFKRLSRGVVPAGSSLLRGYSLSQAFVSQPLIC